MDRSAALGILHAHMDELRRLGVVSAALFGSTARNEAKAGSDIDVMVVLDPAKIQDVFDYVGVVQFIEQIFPEPVDVANRDMLKPHVRPEAERDALYAF